MNLKPNPFCISTYTVNLTTTRRLVLVATFVNATMSGNGSVACERYYCEKCEVTKCSKCSVAIHINKLHGDDGCKVIGVVEKRKFFKCDECSFVTRGKLSLKCHEENTHLGILKYYCSSCAFRHYNGQHVKEHQESNHENFTTDLNVICTLCGEEFSSRIYLRRHFQPSHQDWLIFACDTCNCGNDWEANLKTHKELKHLNGVKSCEICGFRFGLNTQFFELGRA